MMKQESIFSHAIVVDFEATCYDKLERPSSGWRSEIVEFPAVLVRLDTGEVLDEFHRFVRPTETPELSRFCCKFLHLEKDQLDDEEPLENVIGAFNEWTLKVKKEHNLSLYHTGHAFTSNDNVTCIITWTDWDIGTQLREETKRKHIRIPTPIKSWVDLRSIARRHLPLKYGHVPRLRKMFDVMGVVWEGKQHSGIVDARNTAKLALKFVDNLRITRTIGVIGRVKGDKYRFL